ncbi:MAG: DUF1801 domain-containing protein [Deferribacteres bacterium]|nr:DUF1801 domain-containing protein [candidate division KSB1 bacterium]MCB9502285.1 DUF1801 domain-containing protein [Deferribacteres bacterium]
MSHLNSAVTKFLDELNHPFREEIELLREIILSAETGLDENIKWNGPNYSIQDKDRITMRIQPPKQVQLVFHRGAKKQEQPKEKLISTKSKILVWKENDRAVVTIKNQTEIENNSVELTQIIKDWLAATK